MPMNFQDTLPSSVTQTLQDALIKLQDFATTPLFANKMAIAFGEGVEVTDFQSAWVNGDFEDFPEIEIRSASEINGANGAFSADTGKVYLAQEFIDANVNDLDAIKALLLEEYGHYVDSQINESDAAGDEGDIFARLVQGETLSTETLEQLKAEDDSATIVLDGEEIAIEQNTITGTNGNDTLNIGSGNDILIGGQGNDTYKFNSTNVENLGIKTISEYTIALKTVHNHRYVRAGDSNESYNVNQTESNVSPGDWEKFNVINTNDSNKIKIALHTHHNRYLQATNAENASGTLDVSQQTFIGDWEKFTVEPQGNDQVAFLTHHDYYLMATDRSGSWGDSLEVRQQSYIGDWEKFTIKPQDGGIDTLDFSSTTIKSINIDLSNYSQQQVNENLSLILDSALGIGIENVIGGNGNDSLTGNKLNNTLTGRGGWDTLDGKEGYDVAVFMGKQEDFEITYNRDTNGNLIDITVKDRKTDDLNEGTNILKNIEKIEFSDADVPTLSVQTEGTNLINQVKLNIVSASTDPDGSEEISIFLDNVPENVSVSGATQINNSNTYQVNDLNNVILTLPDDTDFDLTVRARSTETANGDFAEVTSTHDIIFDANSNSFLRTFSANGQSMWGTGGATGFADNRFIGLDQKVTESDSNSVTPFTLSTSLDLDLKIGLQSDLNVQGGTINATLPYNLKVDSSYNKTTDVLQLLPTATLNGGSFETLSPNATYKLDLITQAKGTFNAEAAVSVVGYEEYIPIANLPFDVDDQLSIVDFDSSKNVTLRFIAPGDILSVDLAWPGINTESKDNNNGTFSSSGSSNNVIQITGDVDQSLYASQGLPNPFYHKLPLNKYFSVVVDIVDIDLGLGTNVIQNFDMSVKGLKGTIFLENGESRPFDFGKDPLLFYNASGLDLNKDGKIDFDLKMNPDVLMTNDIDLGFNVTGKALVGKVTGTIKYSELPEIVKPFVDRATLGNISLGPLSEQTDVYPITSVDVFKDDFALNFGEESFSLAV